MDKKKKYKNKKMDFAISCYRYCPHVNTKAYMVINNGKHIEVQMIDF